ncbi:hypothetical protein C7402_14261 [Paraburkholderia unamae]|uniref:Bacteriophage CI repressor-like protein n=2 Tax=Paraburkholderia unamae TaxID=219649 RepID=A0ABX5K743_9BURK|nr:hypothetical protein C7402_14261 [Paraburkholderia unamae]
MNRPQPVDQSVVESITCESGLIRKSIELSKFKFLEKTYAGTLGLSASQFSKIKNGRDGAGKVWHMPITAVAAFECLVGHTLMTQWITYQRELLLDDDMRELFEAEQRAAELRAKYKAKTARAA